MSVVFESLLIKFKPILVEHPEYPPASFSSVVNHLKSFPGVESVYLGRPLEKPDYWVLGIRWTSRLAYDAFVSGAATTEWHASLRALLTEHPIVSPIAEYTGHAELALHAPVTEFCTCWGADETFTEDNMKPFAIACEGGGLAGFHGLAYGEFVQGEHKDPSVIPGRASRLLLGWDSKDAHLQHKNSGSVIDDNVYYLLARNKSLEIYHVPLKKL
ncbi:dimeric alpha-beta barrel [Fusarium heterosporum]|uniref:Dimeric alpha-beta barrel n=1 Tax=Fusarium heterosporum TaxID=42747 RepID=A0A8H5SXT0_FUSHE|nr:dimeric alpha-beta barrel [Fusarium heterosporum]